MMSRRARIKCIANIPVRRKTENQTPDVSTKNEEASPQINKDGHSPSVEEDQQRKSQPQNDTPPSFLNNLNVDTISKTESYVQPRSETSKFPPENPLEICPQKKNSETQNNSTENPSEISPQKENSEDSLTEAETTQEPFNPEVKSTRRRILKPAIKIPGGNRTAPESKTASNNSSSEQPAGSDIPESKTEISLPRRRILKPVVKIPGGSQRIPSERDEELNSPTSNSEEPTKVGDGAKTGTDSSESGLLRRTSLKPAVKIPARTRGIPKPDFSAINSEELTKDENTEENGSNSPKGENGSSLPESAKTEPILPRRRILKPAIKIPGGTRGVLETRQDVDSSAKSEEPTKDEDTEENGPNSPGSENGSGLLESNKTETILPRRRILKPSVKILGRTRGISNARDESVDSPIINTEEPTNDKDTEENAANSPGGENESGLSESAKTETVLPRRRILKPSIKIPGGTRAVPETKPKDVDSPSANSEELTNVEAEVKNGSEAVNEESKMLRRSFLKPSVKIPVKIRESTDSRNESNSRSTNREELNTSENGLDSSKGSKPQIERSKPEVKVPIGIPDASKIDDSSDSIDNSGKSEIDTGLDLPEVKPARRRVLKPIIRIPNGNRGSTEGRNDSTSISEPLPTFKKESEGKTPTLKEPGTDSSNYEQSTYENASEILSKPKENLCQEQILDPSDGTEDSSKVPDKTLPKNAETPNREQSPSEEGTIESSRPGVKAPRRWAPKPAVKIPSGIRRVKPPPDSKSETNNENEHPDSETNDTETHILESARISKEVPTDTHDRELLLSESARKSGKESEGLTSPLSPSKMLNRTRIKPAPRLVRRISGVQGAGSESEDDGRRSQGRIRNDSVCSVSSQPSDAPAAKDNSLLTLRTRLSSVRTHKTMRQSEQFRKLSHAKREFYSKFGTKIPDRKRLTMMDLIFYNPVTNPMPQRNTKPANEEKVETILPPTEPTAAEEEEDDPDAGSEEEDSNPVPQVKVGPNGEIILDEQSLVIEQTGTKKGREQLANSQIVNLDDTDRAYGIYKRPKRAKDWSTNETLRFYRTLNTVGTDFSLMLSLFPGRTRRELKMKFKKEERINRQLIDKALMNPLEFDLSQLEKQFQEEKNKEKISGKKKAKLPRKKKRKSTSLLASHMDEENDDVSTKRIKTSTYKKEPKKTEKASDLYSILENGLEDTLPSSSDSEDEIIPRKIRKIDLKEETSPKPAQRRKINRIESSDEETSREPEDPQNHLIPADETTQGSACNESIGIDEDDEDSIHNEEDLQVCLPERNGENGTEIENGATDDVSNILPNELSTLEPGSLMILSSAGPDGQTMYKVFMVTPSQTKVPVNLSQDVVENLTMSLGSAETITLDLPVINMENETILPDMVPDAVST